MTARTDLDRQFKRRQIGLLNHRFETEAQCVRIDGRHLANADTDFARIRSRIPAHLGSHRFQHRIRDSHLVHIFLAGCEESDLLARPLKGHRT
jgi:hypothetical protein